MKSVRILFMCVGVAILLGGVAKAQKMPMDVYIRTAKIDILSGDPERYQEALDYLDSLTHYYGPIPETYFWKSMIYVDFIDKTAELDKKSEYVAEFAAYADSLKQACSNEEIKKKYRKNCEKGDEFLPKTDSTAVKYWREFYNAGVKHLDDIKVIKQDMSEQMDSATQAFYDKKLEAAQDSVIDYMSLTLLLDSSDYKPYFAIATIYGQRGELDKSSEMLQKALDYTTDETSKSQILIQIAYDYLNGGKYCESIPFLRQYLDLAPTDISNMFNLAAVYNRCGKYDSAVVIYRKMYDLDSANVDALTGMGKFYNQMALEYMDSMKTESKAGDTAAARQFTKKRDMAFDSAKVFFRKAFEVAPDDQFVAEELGVVCYVTEDYECAIPAFKKLTEIQPGNADNWTSLGDSYVKTRQWEKAARAYEKVVEIEPNNKPIWESLEALYHQLGETENEKKAQTKLKEG